MYHVVYILFLRVLRCDIVVYFMGTKTNLRVMCLMVVPGGFLVDVESAFSQLLLCVQRVSEAFQLQQFNRAVLCHRLLDAAASEVHGTTWVLGLHSEIEGFENPNIQIRNLISKMLHSLSRYDAGLF